MVRSGCPTTLSSARQKCCFQAVACLRRRLVRRPHVAAKRPGHTAGSTLAVPLRVGTPVTLSRFLERAEHEGRAPSASDVRPVMDLLKGLESGQRIAKAEALTLPTLLPGEQYRFHFDMTRCIGCRCCEVACNEQNGNPAEVTWRRVGEIEGGSDPHVKKFHLSMACNHCLDPACLEGCPTEAYEKLANGIVKHHADLCVGCQYCTWNCPYGVPQYNPERRIVTKCHMCVDRIGGGNLPACVEACPVQAIQIEKIRPDEWRAAIDTANAPGVPPADLTLSTTRITLPLDLPEGFGEQAAHESRPEPAHWSLILFLTLSQASVGLFAFAALALALGAQETSGWSSLVALGLGHAALTCTLFHLGRPLRALGAIRGVRRSWLSREVAAFSAYAGISFVPPAIFLLHRYDLTDQRALWDESLWLTTLIGAVGVYTSVRIYRIAARPAWHSPRTNLQFGATVFSMGAGLGLLVLSRLQAPAPLITITALGLALSMCASALSPYLLMLEAMKGEPALHESARLLSRHFSRLLVVRTVVAAAVIASAAAVCVTPPAQLGFSLLFALVLAASVVEISGRYLFFRCVVPRNMPLGFFAQKPVH